MLHNQVQIYDAEGQGHPLSVLGDLSRGNILFPPCFALQIDLVQKQAFLQSLKVQNKCCTFDTRSDTGELPKVCLTNVWKGNGLSSALKVFRSELIYQDLWADWTCCRNTRYICWRSVIRRSEEFLNMSLTPYPPATGIRLVPYSNFSKWKLCYKMRSTTREVKLPIGWEN